MSVRVRPRVRLYSQLRTAHLERAAQLPPATILFSRKRYDFDEALAAELDLIHAPGWRSALWLLRHPVATLEVNEPLMVGAVRTTGLALVALRLAELAGRTRTRVVTYAIENLDPYERQVAGLKHVVARRLNRWLTHRIWRRVDRVAYGTRASEDLYQRLLPCRSAETQRLIWALPTATSGRPTGEKDPDQLLFLGAFSHRKGFTLLLEAWPQIQAARPGTRLRIIGKGSLQPLAEDLESDAAISVTIDPPRKVILDALAGSQVLVLASQPTPTWREQVGLPIVEGLANGCTIVTTTETGLAVWLEDHGHQVIGAGGTAAELAEAIVDALSRPVMNVGGSLPSEDGRLAADRWLFR